jgi:hypothetical protein
LKDVAKANRNSRLNHFWMQAGDQLDLERSLNLGFGFPAMIVVSPNKQVFGTLRGSFDKKGLNDFLKKAGAGSVPNLEPFPKSGMKFKKADKWDSKDAAIIEEEPLDWDNDEL